MIEPRLIYLLRFYNIRYEDWGIDDEILREDSDSNESSDTSSRLPTTLENAVRSHPEIAHRALASQFGLSYDEIQKFMERAQMMDQEGLQGLIKKRQIEEETPARKRQITRRSCAQGTEVTSPSEPTTS